MSFWRRNKGFVVLSLVLVALIGFTSYTASQRSQPSRMESIILQGLTPLQRASSVVVRKITGLIDDLRGLLTLRADNHELRAQLNSLQMQFDVLVEAERENQRLRQLLGYKQANPDFTLQLAKVIGASQNPWQQELVIDQGSRHGVAVNMPVVTHLGFVGRVYEVAPTSSKVVLMIDPRGPVAAQVQETRVRGTVEADSAHPGKLRFIRLPRDADVQPGHLLVTAGTAAYNLPKGLVIGTVEAVSPTADGLQLEATIEPAVNFNTLEDVLLITTTGGR